MEAGKEPSQKKRKTEAFLDKDPCASLSLSLSLCLGRPLKPQVIDVDAVLDQLLYVRKRMGEQSFYHQLMTILPSFHAATSCQCVCVCVSIVC